MNKMTFVGDSSGENTYVVAGYKTADEKRFIAVKATQGAFRVHFFPNAEAHSIEEKQFGEADFRAKSAYESCTMEVSDLRKLLRTVNKRKAYTSLPTKDVIVAAALSYCMGLAELHAFM